MDVVSRARPPLNEVTSLRCRVRSEDRTDSWQQVVLTLNSRQDVTMRCYNFLKINRLFDKQGLIFAKNIVTFIIKVTMGVEIKWRARRIIIIRKLGLPMSIRWKVIGTRRKKRPANKQVCLGKLDKETGDIIPSKRVKGTTKRAASASAPEVTARTQVAGPYLLLEKLTEQTGLDAMLKKCFPETHSAILSMVYFIVQKGLPLAHCEPWSVGHLHPHGDLLISQRISELLPRLTEDARQQFLSLWLKKMLEKDYLCYDCLLYTSPSPRDRQKSRMPSSA
eukprot:TRINITY_DN9084_c0_g1_i2.p1 TRINITY_DN9084_c0_g1~~TRINITY_DN9084_c0_g1_i2.p1  ORF type:complete len:279 (-),score=-8.04 TRINITY_DN9084_c0_g1_i2:83-919(-)